MSWLSWEDFRVFQENLRHFQENLPRFFKNLRRFCENLRRFCGSVGHFFARFLSSVLGLKMVLIFRFSVKVVKAKSAKVQGCARVSHAREKTTAVWMPLGHRAMSRPR